MAGPQPSGGMAQSFDVQTMVSLLASEIFKLESAKRDAEVGDISTSDGLSSDTVGRKSFGSSFASGESEDIGSGIDRKKGASKVTFSVRGRDDVSSEDISPSDHAESQQQSAGSGTEPYNSLKRNGPRNSKGGARHDDGGCKPCAFYCFSQIGCKHGDECDFCHFFHESKSLVKRMSKTQKAEDPQARQKRDGALGYVGKDSKRNPRGQKASQPMTMEPVPEFSPMPSSSSHLGIPSINDDLQVQEQSVQMDLPISSGDYSRTDNFIAGVTTGERFSYLPDGVVAVVGQKVVLWPAVASSVSRPRVFAVAPKLPQGLEIDACTGVIHGIPQQATEGTEVHFVVSCEPLSNFAVSTATVQVNVVQQALGTAGSEMLAALLNPQPSYSHDANPQQEALAAQLMQEMIRCCAAHQSQ